jgi:hypothetical protein
MKKNARIFFLATLFITFSGCDQNRVVEKTVVVNNGNKTDGGADVGGGGNGIDGKPIEVFKVNIVQSDLFKNLIAPILLKIRVIEPYLASAIDQIARHRGWYIVPVKLNSIPASLLGAPFTTEQLAFQTLYKVWIDQNFFDKMNQNEQKILLIHELIMGTKLLSMRDNFEKCLVFAKGYKFENPQLPDSKLIQLTDQCGSFKKGDESDIKSVDLSSYDYNVINEVTSLLSSKIEADFDLDDQKTLRLLLEDGQLLDYTSIKEYLKFEKE